MRRVLAGIGLWFALSNAANARSESPASGKPTIVLVHGAFAESSSWNGVIGELVRDGYPVIAAAVPLRSLEGDAQYVANLTASVPGSVVLVGHSYGGAVISVAAASQSNVRALVFVAGFALDVGESAASRGARFPMGTLGPTLGPPVKLADGSADLYILQGKYWKQFASDVPQADASVMAVTQRPIAQAALGEQAGAKSWDRLPSWFVWGAADHNIPSDLQRFMARRANARQAIEIPGASHVVMITHARQVAAIIERAAK